MELRRYLRLIRQRLTLLVAAIIAGAVIGYVTTSRVPVYTASAEIYVGNADLGTNQVQLYAEAGLNEIVATFAEMIPSPVIAQKAIDRSHVHRFAGEVAASTSATVVPGTNLIEVDVSDLSAKVARRLADAVSNAFVAQVSHYQSGTTAGQGQVPNEPAYVFQDATTASASSSGVTKKVLLGALFGLVISILLILLLDYLDISIKSPEELERRVGLPVLGIIPSFSSLQLDNIRTGSLPRTSNG